MSKEIDRQPPKETGIEVSSHEFKPFEIREMPDGRFAVNLPATTEESEDGIRTVTTWEQKKFRTKDEAWIVRENDPEFYLSQLIRNDYLNEYLDILGFVRSFSKEKPKAPRSFSERYKKIRPTTPEQRDRILELNRLSVEARRLLDEETINTKVLSDIVIAVAGICQRPDWIEKVKSALTGEEEGG